MKQKYRTVMFSAVILFGAALASFGQPLPAEIKPKAEGEIKHLMPLRTDPQVVAAVRAHDALPDPCHGMNNEQWKNLSVLDPFVRSFSKSPLAEYLRSTKRSAVSELFVSGSEGCKVAFLAKTTWFNHRGKPKHDVPMTGKIYIGPVEIDDSTGQEQFQVGLPVLDGNKPIGSVVVGLRVASLR